ncbi:hypothetical protein [Streptomyces sp. NPDC101455]|uniref:hypothetical protein n=1 Tax=Streptomyces sp. NPDC101455 TaxID=3366142 RepID=UPI003806F3C1
MTPEKAYATVRTLLDRGDIFATPECRVRLEGRARYNLAFDAAKLRQAAVRS